MNSSRKKSGQTAGGSSTDKSDAGKPQPLERSFYARDTALVARELLGKVLVRDLGDALLKGRIVETEAYYGPSDPASHASSGKTERSAIMWESPGLAYVYLVYGNHYLLNAVTESRGEPGAVLIRALEPLDGLEVMRGNREVEDKRTLTDGPGKLAQAFQITKKHNGNSLIEAADLWIEESCGDPGEEVGTSSRIGIREGKEEQYRFYLRGNPYLSRRS